MAQRKVPLEYPMNAAFIYLKDLLYFTWEMRNMKKLSLVLILSFVFLGTLIFAAQPPYIIRSHVPVAELLSNGLVNQSGWLTVFTYYNGSSVTQKISKTIQLTNGYKWNISLGLLEELGLGTSVSYSRTNTTTLNIFIPKLSTLKLYTQTVTYVALYQIKYIDVWHDPSTNKIYSKLSKIMPQYGQQFTKTYWNTDYKTNTFPFIPNSNNKDKY